MLLRRQILTSLCIKALKITMTFDEDGWLCYFVQMRKVIEKLIYGSYNISIQNDDNLQFYRGG